MKQGLKRSITKHLALTHDQKDLENKRNGPVIEAK